MATTTFQKLILSTALLGITACGTAETSICEEAADHVAACFPDQSGSPESCDPQQAETVLEQDCEQLQASAADSSADAFCNPFFWWTCGGSGGGSSDVSDGYTFNLGVHICSSELCVEDLFGTNDFGATCAKITLEDEEGNLVAVDYFDDHLTWGGVQGTSEGFKNLDLPPGRYVAKMLTRDGNVAQHVEGGDALITVDLLEDGEVDLSASKFRLLEDEAEAVRACSDVTGTLASTCDGEPMSKEETEWGWFIEIEGVNAEGTYANLKRSGFVFSLDSHSYLFPKVRAGEYTIRYVEMDVSSWARENNLKYEDYLELKDRYETERETTLNIEITNEDIARGEYVTLQHIDLESETCL